MISNNANKIQKTEKTIGKYLWQQIQITLCKFNSKLPREHIFLPIKSIHIIKSDYGRCMIIKQKCWSPSTLKEEKHEKKKN